MLFKSALIARIDHHYRKNPSAICIRVLDRFGAIIEFATYTTLRERILETLGHFERIGVRRLALALPQGLDLVTLLLAGIEAGCAPTLIDPGTSPAATQRRRRIEELIRPDLVIAMDAAPGQVAVGDLAATPPSRRETPETLDGDVAYLQFTSGSTGSPRGIAIREGALLSNLDAIQTAFGHSSRSEGVIWLPPYHDMGLVGGILQPLWSGFPVNLISTADFIRRPRVWLEAISTWRGTTSGGPNFGWSFACDRTPAEAVPALDLSAWTVAFVGAEPIDRHTLERFGAHFAPAGFRQSAFYPCYGLAEATLFVSGGPSGRGLETTIRPDGSHTDIICGAPAIDTTVLIVDPDRCSPCGPGETGEIWVAGPSVASGYIPPDANDATTFQARLAGAPTGQTYLRTGDLGYLDHHGRPIITGRLKAMLKVHGRKILAEDVERSLALRFADFGMIAAVPLFGDGPEGVTVGYESRAPLPARTVEDVREHLIREFGFAPQQVVRLARGAFARTTSGKLARGLAQAQIAALVAATPIEEAPPSATPHAAGQAL
jgi:acyl-CoA synthetase (AMP-forming)/AMP-acid ligase II